MGKRTEKKRLASNAQPVSEQRQTLCENLSFTAAESYKLLRTNLMFSIPQEGECRSVGVTSSINGEGKSTTAINLAYSIAETGARVLLIDGDMRLPSVAKKLEMPKNKGLSNCLAGLCTVHAVIQHSKLQDSWDILAAGEIPPNPSELLGSQQMTEVMAELKKEYDFIVMDLPPVNVVSDALIASHLVDGILLTVREGYSDRKSLDECMRQLTIMDTKLLGFVMNDSEESSKNYGRKYLKRRYKKYGYGYGKSYGYGYGYGYGEKPKKEAEKSASGDQKKA